MYAELCNSGEYPNLPQRRLTEILRGREVSKAKNFKGKFEFQGGEGVQTKSLSVGGVWTISGTTHSEYRFALFIVKKLSLV